MPVARVRHFLVVGGETSHDDLAALAAATFLAARIRSEPASGRWQLAVTRHTRVTELGPGSAEFPLAGKDEFSHAARAYAVDTLRERTAPPHFPLPDRDRVAERFGDGIPHREERRIIDWLIAVARRARGAVVLNTTGENSIADGPTYAVIRPDPEANVDRLLISPVWLTPEAAAHVCGRVAHGAYLAAGSQEWAGPAAWAEEADQIPSVLGAAARARLHEAIDALDVAALTAPEVLDGYAVVIPMAPTVPADPAGLTTPNSSSALAVPAVDPDREAEPAIVVEVSACEVLPVALRDEDRLRAGCIEYRITWAASDEELVHAGDLTAELRQERTEARRLIQSVTAALRHAAGGYVLDQDGFFAGP